MNVDRKLFLALAASLAAVACSSTGEDDGSGSAAPEVNAANPPPAGTPTTEGAPKKLCWEPTTESISGASHDFFTKDLGFDPVKDFPAAEGFCMELAAPDGFGTPGSLDFESKASLFEKCSAFAKIYVPFTTYNAFFKMKQEVKGKGLSTTAAFAKLYAIDKGDSTDEVVCVTDAAKQLCLGVADKGCQALASQLKPASHQKFIACMGEGFSAFNCAEGGAELR